MWDYEIQKIGEGTWRISEYAVSVFLLEGTEKALLLDTGAGIGDLKAEAEKLTHLPLIVVNTHGHIDHAGGNQQFDEVHLARADFQMAEETCGYADRQDYARTRLERFCPEKLQEGLDALLPDGDWKKVPLEDGDKIELGERTLEVIATPGHTAGSICLLDEKNRLLFTGDMVNPCLLLQKMWGSEPMEIYLESLRKMQSRAGEYDRIVRSHGEALAEKEEIARLSGVVEKIQSKELSGTYQKDSMRDGFVVRADGFEVWYDGFKDA